MYYPFAQLLQTWNGIFTYKILLHLAINVFTVSNVAKFWIKKKNLQKRVHFAHIHVTN